MTRFLSIVADQRPAPIGADAQNRALYSCNYRAEAAAPVAEWEKCLAKLIIDAGLATALPDPNPPPFVVPPPPDIFIGPMSTVPAGDGPLIVILDTGGMSPLATHDGKKYERLSAQVVVRAADPYLAMQRALGIWRLLDGIYNTDVAA